MAKKSSIILAMMLLGHGLNLSPPARDKKAQEQELKELEDTPVEMDEETQGLVNKIGPTKIFSLFIEEEGVRLESATGYRFELYSESEVPERDLLEGLHAVLQNFEPQRKYLAYHPKPSEFQHNGYDLNPAFNLKILAPSNPYISKYLLWSIKSPHGKHLELRIFKNRQNSYAELFQANEGVLPTYEEQQAKEENVVAYIVEKGILHLIDFFKSKGI